VSNKRTALSRRQQRGLWPGPCGGIEVCVALPDEPPVGVAVLCHPHPLHGGQMDNKVITTLARAFDESAYVTVRFNFRGVGQSAGTYDSGKGELDDCSAVLDESLRRFSALPWSLAGFSFGAFVAARAALQRRPEHLVLIAPPVGRFELPTPVSFSCPTLVCQGNQDDVVAARDVRAWVHTVSSQCAYQEFDDCGHFFHGYLPMLRQSVHAFIAQDKP
jgi:alpha/beta superfamily hydrolase